MKNNKKLFFRSWDNWASDALVYQAITDPIPPHPLLYFSIKHTSKDFLRRISFNNQLGVGKHAQIIEVELQREYEGKGAHPNYVMNYVINGFPEVTPSIGLQDVINKPQIKGMWSWTRGGGWWGPYIHGNEIHVDLHAHVLATWWNSGGKVSEEDAFNTAVTNLLDGCDASCVSSYRNISMSSAEALLLGRCKLLTDMTCMS